jgi:hypothetical protein
VSGPTNNSRGAETAQPQSREVKIVVAPACQCAEEALRGLIDDWLVPALVEAFVEERYCTTIARSRFKAAEDLALRGQPLPVVSGPVHLCKAPKVGDNIAV